MKFEIIYLNNIDDNIINNSIDKKTVYNYTKKINNDLQHIYYDIIKQFFIDGYDFISITNINNNDIETCITYNYDIHVISNYSFIKHNNLCIYDDGCITLSRKGMKVILDIIKGDVSTDINFTYYIDKHISNNSANNTVPNVLANIIINYDSIYYNKEIFDDKPLIIGSFGMFDTKGDTIKSEFVQKYYIDTLNNAGIKCKYGDCFTENCDIIIYSLFNYRYNFKTQTYNRMDYCAQRMLLCKGYPIFIYYTPENETHAWSNVHNSFEENAIDSYTMSFFEDNEKNLYWPLWVQRYDIYKDVFANRQVIPLCFKKKFCTFIVSNESSEKRSNLFDYISKNYKQIDSIGKHKNNQPNNWMLPKEDYKETSAENIRYHIPYKFNLCFENSESSDNLSYITEKIMDAFLYRTVPIYCGSSNIEKYFNKNAFINCTGLSFDEILEKIKEIDNDDEKYYNILNSHPFLENINYVEYYNNRYIKFLKNILKENNYEITI